MIYIYKRSNGVFTSTDSDSNRIVINSNNKSVTLYSRDNEPMGKIYYTVDKTGEDWNLWQGAMSLRLYSRENTTKFLYREIVIDPANGIRHYTYDINGNIIDTKTW